MHEDGQTAGFVGEGGVPTGVPSRACLCMFIQVSGGGRSG